jgi:hypothetical protein
MGNAATNTEGMKIGIAAFFFGATYQFLVGLLLFWCFVVVRSHGCHSLFLLLLRFLADDQLRAPRHVVEVAVGIDGEDVDERRQHEYVLEEVKDDGQNVHMHNCGGEEDANGSTTKELEEERIEAARAVLARARLDVQGVHVFALIGGAIPHRHFPRAIRLTVASYSVNFVKAGNNLVGLILKHGVDLGARYLRVREIVIRLP